jgi:hypothetical protein
MLYYRKAPHLQAPGGQQSVLSVVDKSPLRAGAGSCYRWEPNLPLLGEVQERPRGFFSGVVRCERQSTGHFAGGCSQRKA